jgi:hypothetical protein
LPEEITKSAVIETGVAETRTGETVVTPLRLFELFDFPATLLPVPLAGECCFNPLLFTWLQIERVTLNFLDDVFLLHFSFEAAEGVF